MKIMVLWAGAAAVAATTGAFAADAYIEADGTQAIVTDYYPNPTTKIVADDRASDARDTRLRQRHRVPVPLICTKREIVLYYFP